MSLPDCPYREPLEPGSSCLATEYERVDGRTRLDNRELHVPTMLSAGACCCEALLLTGHCPEGWR